MTLEEKLKEKSQIVVWERQQLRDARYFDAVLLKDAIEICKQEIEDATSETYSNGFTDGYNSCCESFKPMIESACKKQREICASKVAWIDASHSYGVYDSVLNAPSPLDEVK